MDNFENQPSSETVQETPQPQHPPYTSSISPKKKSPLWILMILAIILILGGIFFLAKKSFKKESTSATPESLGSQTSEPVTTQEATSTPVPVDKTNIKIQISNGTGIPKEASFLQGKLRTLGYTNISVDNADNENYSATEVTFASSVSEVVVDEVTTELEKIYESVKTKTGSSGSYDIKIITGLQKGATAKPAATKSPTPSATPKASGTASPTPTP